MNCLYEHLVFGSTTHPGKSGSKAVLVVVVTLVVVSVSVDVVSVEVEVTVEVVSVTVVDEIVELVTEVAVTVVAVGSSVVVVVVMTGSAVVEVTFVGKHGPQPVHDMTAHLTSHDTSSVAHHPLQGIRTALGGGDGANEGAVVVVTAVVVLGNRTSYGQASQMNLRLWRQSALSNSWSPSSQCCRLVVPCWTQSWPSSAVGSTNEYHRSSSEITPAPS